MSILINNNRYIFEFKVGNKDALEQIKNTMKNTIMKNQIFILLV